MNKAENRNNENNTTERFEHDAGEYQRKVEESRHCADEAQENCDEPGGIRICKTPEEVLKVAAHVGPDAYAVLYDTMAKTTWEEFHRWGSVTSNEVPTYMGFYALWMNSTEFRSPMSFLFHCGADLDLRNSYQGCKVLFAVYEMSHGTMRDIRGVTGLSLGEFCGKLSIRTDIVEEWERENLRTLDFPFVIPIAYSVISMMMEEWLGFFDD